MKDNVYSLETNIFRAGEKILISKDGHVKLPVPFDSEQEALFVKTENIYKVIPLLLMRLAWEMKVRTAIVTNLLPYHETLKDEIVYDIDDTGNLFGNESWLIDLQAQMPYMKLRTERYCKFIQDKSLCVSCAECLWSRKIIACP